MQDDDGAAYIAYSSEKNRVMHVARLTDDYKGVVNQYLRTMVLTPRPLRSLRTLHPKRVAAHLDSAAEQALLLGICLHVLLELPHSVAVAQRKGPSQPGKHLRSVRQRARSCEPPWQASVLLSAWGGSQYETCSRRELLRRMRAAPGQIGLSREARVLTGKECSV